MPRLPQNSPLKRPPVADLGLARDGLPHCPTCNDLRRIRADVPVGHPDFGRLIYCPSCGEQALRQHLAHVHAGLRERIGQYSMRIGRYARQTFERFDVGDTRAEGYDVSIRNAYTLAKCFAQNLRLPQEPYKWLVLYGSRGTGKSHLAAAIVNYLETLPEPERPVTMFVVVPDLLDLLRSGYRRGDYEDLLDLCKQVQVLVLDDLGTEAATDWAAEKLFQVLNYRYQAEQPTVIATNCRLEELEPRLCDRLSDDDFCERVAMVGPSYRQRRSAPGVIV